MGIRDYRGHRYERRAERMDLSTRSRSVLVLAPIISALSLFTVICSIQAKWIELELPVTALSAAVAAVGAGTVALTARSVLRTTGRARVIWSMNATMATAGMFMVLGHLTTWPARSELSDWVIWGALRIPIVAAFGVVAVVLHRIWRPTRREWSLLLLDGWLVAASTFMICWVALSVTERGGILSASTHPALLWVPADLAVATVIVGLAMRGCDNGRGPAFLMLLVALLSVVVDVTWALTGDPGSGAVLWMVQMMSLACATVLEPRDLWPLRGTETSPPLLRLSHWAVAPGLIAAVIPVGDLTGDPVVIVTAVSIVLGLTAELAMSGRQNLTLWQTLRSQALRLDLLLRESRDAIVQVDGTGTVRFANDAVSEVLGCPTDDVVGRQGLDLVHPDDRERLVREVTLLGERDSAGRVSGRFHHADGTWHTFEATVSRRIGGEPGYTLSARDVSERVTLEHELRRLAGTDTLTSLLNRPAFFSVLKERLQEGPTTVLFVDLDGFKAVNDMEGHAAGDRLLREVSTTLRHELRGPDVAARLGGDEFAILLGTDSVDEARAVADRLVQRLCRMPSDPARRTAASVGVATGHRVSAETLLGDADLAMYEAKARGGRRYVIFEPWMRERITERARMSTALEQACAGEGLLLDVQPIVDMKDGTWVGFEALARWQDGQHRRQPQEFLPVAEENGLIDPIGRWVLHRSLTWLTRWPDRAAGISVNVAGSQLATPGFGDWVHQQLAGLGVAPDRLTLEISERTELGNLQRATAVLQPLRALGVRIALDDFGTGFSSLGHLADLPVDELKIDRRFVIGLGRRAQDEVVVSAICRLGHDLDLRVVAEGVETAAQEFSLIEHGCRLGQGFRFQRPTSAGQITLPTAEDESGATGWPRDPRTRAS
jgi:diguanylate cyclase (GGDEF)-like protein/PAS domain S-box-containing protein